MIDKTIKLPARYWIWMLYKFHKRHFVSFLMSRKLTMMRTPPLQFFLIRFIIRFCVAFDFLNFLTTFLLRTDKSWPIQQKWIKFRKEDEIHIVKLTKLYFLISPVKD